MKTNMQETSLEAYRHIEPDLGPMQQRVLNFLKRNADRDFTNKQLAYELDKPINTITPRVLELRELGLVTFSKYVRQSNGRRARAWKVKERGLNPERFPELCEDSE